MQRNVVKREPTCDEKTPTSAHKAHKRQDSRERTMAVEKRIKKQAC